MSPSSHISALNGAATSALPRLAEEACSDCWLREQPELRRAAFRAATRNQYGSEISLAPRMLRTAVFLEGRSIRSPPNPYTSRQEQSCERSPFGHSMTLL